MTVFSDNFSDNSKGWHIYDSAELSFHVENGGYVIEQRQDSGWRSTWKNFANHTHGDLGIQIKIQKILGASDSYYGIIWAGDDKNNFNCLLVNFKKQFVLRVYPDNGYS